MVAYSSTTSESIVNLAEAIARAAPECAEMAMQIVFLVQDVELQPDRSLVQDAIESKLVDSELSESQIQSTTSAVVSAVRNCV